MSDPNDAKPAEQDAPVEEVAQDKPAIDAAIIEPTAGENPVEGVVDPAPALEQPPAEMPDAEGTHAPEVPGEAPLGEDLPVEGGAPDAAHGEVPPLDAPPMDPGVIGAAAHQPHDPRMEPMPQADEGAPMPIPDDAGVPMGLGAPMDAGGFGDYLGAGGAPNVGPGGLTVRSYLDTTVVPVLRKALRELVRQRPADPYDFLAKFILDNKPS